VSREHVGIVCEDPEKLRAHMWVAPVVIIDSPEYAQGAVIPNFDKRHRPNDSELELFLADSSTPSSGCIEFLLPSDGLAQLIDDIGSAPDYKVLGSIHCIANQLTTTVDERFDLKAGFHFDNHEKRPIHTRAASKRRIGWNEGPSSRYFLLTSVDVFDIANLYHPGDPRYIPRTEELRQYVHEGRDILCAGVEVPRGCAYGGPTEQAGHDATAVGCGPSTAHFYHGDWPVGSLEALY